MNSSIRGLIYRYTDYKKLLWPLNAIIFNLLRLWPYRDKHLWVFGALKGSKYDDNSRYLFEYVNQQDEDGIRAVWLAKNEEVIVQIRSKGYEAYNCYSWMGIRIALTAGIVFYTHSLSDFGKIPLVGGAKIICLWHGFSFKRIYNYNYTGIKAILKKFSDSIFNWVYRDYSMVSSEYTKKQYLAEFNIPNTDSIFITGQPRNDDLFKIFSLKDVFAKCETRFHNKKIILYMPTYRAGGQDSQVLEDIVKDLMNNIELNDFLEKNNYVFLIKLHPRTHLFTIPESKSFHIISFNDVLSNQALLTMGEMLITDYSGAFVDYALLHRPIIFYAPDKKDYIKYSGKLEEDFEIVSASCFADNPKQLLDILENPPSLTANIVNEYFMDKSIEGTCFSANVYNIVKKIAVFD